jgi:hypothetical protein
VRRRFRTREVAAAAVALLGIAGVVVLLAAYAPRWWGDAGGTFAPEGLTVGTRVEPRTSLFGDLITLRADVLVDRRAVDPNSVRVEARLTPFRVVSTTRKVHELGGSAARVEVAYGMQCLSIACLNAAGQTNEDGAVTATPIKLRAARAVGVRTNGAELSAPFAWPDVVVHSRLTSEELKTGDPSVGPFVTPKASWSVSPDLAAALLLAAGVLLALGGGWLLADAVRGKRVPLRLRLPAHLTPLDRALALVRDAATKDDAVDERKALERLAAELRRRGDAELAGAAGRLAWSAERPSAEAVDELTASVSRSSNGR